MEQTHIDGWQKKMNRHLIMIVSSTNRWSSWKRSEGGGTEVFLGSRRWVDMNKNWEQINVSSEMCELLLFQCPPRTKTMAMAMTMVRAMTMTRRGRGRWSRQHMADGEWNKCQTNEDLASCACLTCCSILWLRWNLGFPCPPPLHCFRL